MRYEILVAAALKSESYENGGKSLNLTSFTFNVNPPTYNTKLTGVGFGITMDLMAVRDDITFLIECKSSSKPSEVLKVSSESFLKAVLEFTALQNFSEVSGWNYQYLLVANFPIGKEIQDLFNNMTPEQLNRLAKKVKEFGAREYGNRFNADLISPEILRRTLNATNVILLTDQFLREKLRSDDTFKMRCQEFESKLRTPKLGAVPERGVLVSQGYSSITFLCKSEIHENCRELPINGFLCHVGNVAEIIHKILYFYEKRKSSVFCLMRGRELGYSPDGVQADQGVSSKDIAKALTKVLNNLFAQTANCELILLVVPGTYDIVTANKKKLARLIHSTYDPISTKYDLGSISELEGLGGLVKVSLAIEVLEQEFKIMTTAEDYIAGEESYEEAE